MHAPRLRGALIIVAATLAAAVTACKSGTEPSKPTPAQLSVTAGGSSGLINTSVPLTVTVRASDNRVVAGASVTFQVTSGTATVSPTTTTTDANGQATTTLTFGSTEGAVDVTVTVTGTNLTQVIHATAIAPFGQCDGSTAATLTVGEVRTPITQLGVCVNGGAAGAEFALVPFNSSTTYSSIAGMTFVSHNATQVTTPPLALVPATGASLNAAPIGGSMQSLLAPATSFDTRLREAERRVLTPLIPLARAWQARGGAGGTAIRPSYATTSAPLTVGQIVPLNVRSGPSFDDACTTPDIRFGRVVAIGTKAAVVADTANPAGGYTDAEYQTIANNFDNLVYNLDVNSFGGPTDIDSNGKIILFFTRAVNELTPRASESIVGGFFYARDLFPKTATATLDACTTSNVAELFYLLVPDPNGVVNGNVRQKSFVSRLSISTTAHEFQHLINAARRLYVNNADSLEVVWLNEGLSHIAEELLFYEESEGLHPRMDLDSSSFSTAHTQNRDAYNNDQQSNFGRYRTYIQRPDTASPYAPNDELATRGATWSFLRYAADHRGTADADVWFQLVNTASVGFSNLQNVFGSNLPFTFRDWATSNLTDDVPGVGAAWQQPSWNFRSMYMFLSRTFPLGTLTVGDNASLNVALNGGSVAFVRFAVASNVVASVQWNGPPPKVAMTLVRLK